MALSALRVIDDPGPAAALERANSQSIEFIRDWRRKNPNRVQGFAEFSRLKHDHPVFGWVACKAAGVDFLMFHANDDVVAWEYLWFGADGYESDIAQTWVDWCRTSPGAILDVGAYSGCMAILAGLANPKNTVHLFEPVERTVERAKINVLANGLQDRVKIHARAASEKAGEVRINLYRGEDFLGTGSSIYQKPGKEIIGTKIIQTVAPDRHLGDLSPTVIKIDAEGHELACLKGMDAMIRRSRPKMIIEVWAHDRAEVLTRLHGLGYDCRPFEKREAQVMTFRCEPR